MSHVIRMRSLVWHFYMPGVADVSFGLDLRQWGLLLTWGDGWCEFIALCFQITVESDVRPTRSLNAPAAKDDDREH